MEVDIRCALQGNIRYICSLRYLVGKRLHSNFLILQNWKVSYLQFVEVRHTKMLSERMNKKFTKPKSVFIIVLDCLSFISLSVYCLTI